MYIPKAFEEIRIPVIHALIESQPFGSLITMGSSGLLASHVPMVLETEGSPLGVLKCHLSRANAQWKEFAREVEALAIFAGPHHYISPSWYPETVETGRAVPTWNYAVAHAYGQLRVVEDADWLRANVEALTNIHEAEMPAPWKVTDAPADYVSTMIRGIVGLELTITRLEGKWKASQNRPERDRLGVIEGLAEIDTESSRAMQTMVRERGKGGV
jgi:transcriptional regulator